MSKFFNGLKNVVLALFIAAIVFIAGFYFCCTKSADEEAEVVEESVRPNDFELPMEVERRVVTVEEVESKLSEIGELSTYSGEYTCTVGKEEQRYFLENVPVPGSTNSIEVTCKGVVKVGFDMDDIVVSVEDDKIYVSIPEAKIHDNYVIWDSVTCNEDNNIFNPIEFAQYQDIITDIETKGLEDVIRKGIYRKAEDNLMCLINAFLSGFSDYSVVYR